MTTLLAQEEEEANEIIPTCRKVKRLAVIDGCNVIHACAGMSTHAYHEFGERKPKPDAIGLLIVLKRLLDEDFEVRMFISSRFMSVKETNNFFILEALVKFNYLAVVPAYLYDDIPILYWASKCAGFVISNDKYREFKSIPLCCEATTRVIKFAFKPMDLQEIGGKKALGKQEHKFRFGMDLCLDLDRRICMSDIREDTNFLNVYSTRRRHNINKAARARQPCLCLMEVLSVMADFLQQQFCFVHGMEPPHLDYIGESANPSTQFETFIGLIFDGNDNYLI